MTIRQVLCGLSGHDYMLRFEDTRMALVCTECQHETPGWDDIGTAPPTAVVTTPRRAFKRDPELATA